ncbi:MAG: hypothetical protein QOF66_3960, partial [Mycobacterium sp.]|nr:hypothetical protein [Mycobacterium sp.]
HLVDAVRTGCDPATTALGTDVFTYFERNPDAARLFTGAMASLRHHPRTTYTVQ